MDSLKPVDRILRDGDSQLKELRRVFIGRTVGVTTSGYGEIVIEVEGVEAGFGKDEKDDVKPSSDVLFKLIGDLINPYVFADTELNLY